MSIYTGRFPADSPIFAGRELLANRIRTHAEYYVGLDLAQVQDYTAIVIVERVEVVMPEVDRVTYQHRMETRFHLRHAERVPLGISYPDIVAHVKRLVDKAPLRGHCKLIVDATGVGAPIVEFRRFCSGRATLRPVAPQTARRRASLRPSTAKSFHGT